MRSVIFEAIVVGIINLLLFMMLRRFTNIQNIFLVIFLCGVLIHLGFEYSPFGNLNEKWCKLTFPATKPQN